MFQLLMQSELKLTSQFLELEAKALVCELKLYAENFGQRAKAQCVIFGELSLSTFAEIFKLGAISSKTNYLY